MTFNCRMGSGRRNLISCVMLHLFYTSRSSRYPFGTSALNGITVFVAWLFKSSYQTTEPYTHTTALTNAGLSLANTGLKLLELSLEGISGGPPHYVALALIDRSQLSRSRCKLCTSKSTPSRTRSCQRRRCFAHSTYGYLATEAAKAEEGLSRLTLWTQPPLGSALRCDIFPSRAHKARTDLDNSHVSYSPSLCPDAVSRAAEKQTYGASALLQHTANFEIERTWFLVESRASFEGRAGSS
ncbi:hypothetical protein EDB89DRAFT_2042322 [Lactarius sanguifluus]|nr:hypothetical protein EDB89DRAFT_2042322 [Lactarius sanguifluus]